MDLYGCALYGGIARSTKWHHLQDQPAYITDAICRADCYSHSYCTSHGGATATRNARLAFSYCAQFETLLCRTEHRSHRSTEPSAHPNSRDEGCTRYIPTR